MNKQLIRNESGQGLTEYMILLLLIAVACLSLVSQVGDSVKKRFEWAKAEINTIQSNGTRSAE